MSKQEKISLKENGNITLEGSNDKAVLEWESTSEGNVKSICITIYKHNHAKQEIYECRIKDSIAHDGSIYGMNSIARILRNYFVERVAPFAVSDKPHELSTTGENIVSEMIPIRFKKKSELQDIYLIEGTADGVEGKRCIIVNQGRQEIMKWLTKWDHNSFLDMEFYNMKFVKGMENIVETPRFGKIDLCKGFIKQVYIPQEQLTYVIEVRKKMIRIDLKE